MKKLFLRIQSLKYKQKLILLCGFIGIVPLIIIGIFCYHQTVGMLRTQEHNSLAAATETASNAMDAQIRLYEDMLYYLCTTEVIINTPEMSNASLYEQYEWMTYELDVFLNGIYMQHSEIESVTIYTTCNDFAHGSHIRPIKDLEQESWYDASAVGAKPSWHRNQDGSLLLIQKLPAPYIRYIEAFSPHYVGIRLDADRFFQTLEHISSDYRLTVSCNQETFYSYADASVEKLSSSTDWTTLARPTANGNWNIVLEKPTTLLFAPADRMALIVLVIILVCVCLLFFSASLFADYFVKRINILHQNMQKVREGDLQVHIHDDCPDEVGQLTNHFQNMIDEINRLIQEDYQNKLTLRDSQLKALQAQINPHFLYNCLSLINSRALMNGQQDISRMSLLLSTFYRTTLNKGRSDTLLVDEIKNVTSYIEIQQLLHDNCFSVTYQIDRSLEQITVPNLLLQPLVENAIIHGLLPLKDKRGKLFITVSRAGDKVYFTVLDNGVGIPPKKLPLLTRTDSGGYGLKNVHDRLRLAYGEAYGLTINSIQGESTMITFCVPCIISPF